MKIKIDDIEEDKCNFNRMTPEEYDSLKNSIKLRKVKDNIILRLNPLNKNKYIIVSGHYRIKALKDLGYTEIPNEKINEDQIIIDPNMSETVALEQLFDSNIRGNIDPIKYIEFLLHYMKIHNINQTELSKRLGINKHRLSKILSITKSPELMKHLRNWDDYLIKTQGLTMKHLVQLARLNDNPQLQYEIFEDYIFQKGISANQLKKEIDRRMSNAEIIDQQLICIEDEELAEKLREKYEPKKYDKDSYKVLIEEIKKRTRMGKAWTYYFPPDEFTEEEVKQYAKEHNGEYCGKHTKTFYKAYVEVSIKELEEGKRKPEYPRRIYKQDFDESFWYKYTWCYICGKLIKKKPPTEPYNFCSGKCLKAKSRRLKR